MMRKYAVLLVTILCAMPAAAQRVNVDFPELADRADEVVDVTLDAAMLRLGAKFLSSHDPDQQNVRDMVGKLDGIYVRSYSFEHAGEYDMAILNRVRGQLGSSWKKIVNVRSKMKENTEIYIDQRGDAIAGLLVIA